MAKENAAIENNYLKQEIRELRKALDDAKVAERAARELVFNRIIKPQLELEDLISQYNNGIFEDSFQDRKTTLTWYSERFDELRAKHFGGTA